MAMLDWRGWGERWGEDSRDESDWPMFRELYSESRFEIGSWRGEVSKVRMRGRISLQRG
jgi:hypothetical protein